MREDPRNRSSWTCQYYQGLKYTVCQVTLARLGPSSSRRPCARTSLCSILHSPCSPLHQPWALQQALQFPWSSILLYGLRGPHAFPMHLS